MAEVIETLVYTGNTIQTDYSLEVDTTRYNIDIGNTINTPNEIKLANNSYIVINEDSTIPQNTITIIPFSYITGIRVILPLVQNFESFRNKLDIKDPNWAIDEYGLLKQISDPNPNASPVIIQNIGSAENLKSFMGMLATAYYDNKHIKINLTSDIISTFRMELRGSNAFIEIYSETNKKWTIKRDTYDEGSVYFYNRVYIHDIVLSCIGIYSEKFVLYYYSILKNIEFSNVSKSYLLHSKALTEMKNISLINCNTTYLVYTVLYIDGLTINSSNSDIHLSDSNTKNQYLDIKNLNSEVAINTYTGVQIKDSIIRTLVLNNYSDTINISNTTIGLLSLNLNTSSDEVNSFYLFENNNIDKMSIIGINHYNLNKKIISELTEDLWKKLSCVNDYFIDLDGYLKSTGTYKQGNPSKTIFESCSVNYSSNTSPYVDFVISKDIGITLGDITITSQAGKIYTPHDLVLLYTHNNTFRFILDGFATISDTITLSITKNGEFIGNNRLISVVPTGVSLAGSTLEILALEGVNVGISLTSPVSVGAYYLQYTLKDSSNNIIPSCLYNYTSPNIQIFLEDISYTGTLYLTIISNSSTIYTNNTFTINFISNIITNVSNGAILPKQFIYTFKDLKNAFNTEDTSVTDYYIVNNIVVTENTSMKIDKELKLHPYNKDIYLFSSGNFYLGNDTVGSLQILGNTNYKFIVKSINNLQSLYIYYGGNTTFAYKLYMDYVYFDHCIIDSYIIRPYTSTNKPIKINNIRIDNSNINSYILYLLNNIRSDVENLVMDNNIFKSNAGIIYGSTNNTYFKNININNNTFTGTKPYFNDRYTLNLDGGIFNSELPIRIVYNKTLKKYTLLNITNALSPSSKIYIDPDYYVIGSYVLQNTPSFDNSSYIELYNDEHDSYIQNYVIKTNDPLASPSNAEIARFLSLKTLIESGTTDLTIQLEDATYKVYDTITSNRILTLVPKENTKIIWDYYYPLEAFIFNKPISINSTYKLYLDCTNSNTDKTFNYFSANRAEIVSNIYFKNSRSSIVNTPSGSSAIIKNCIFENCENGIFYTSSSTTSSIIKNCKFINCKGSIFNSFVSKAYIIDCEFINNNPNDLLFPESTSSSTHDSFYGGTIDGSNKIPGAGSYTSTVYRSTNKYNNVILKNITAEIYTCLFKDVTIDNCNLTIRQESIILLEDFDNKDVFFNGKLVVTKNTPTNINNIIIKRSSYTKGKQILVGLDVDISNFLDKITFENNLWKLDQYGKLILKVDTLENINTTFILNVSNFSQLSGAVDLINKNSTVKYKICVTDDINFTGYLNITGVGSTWEIYSDTNKSLIWGESNYMLTFGNYDTIGYVHNIQLKRTTGGSIVSTYADKILFKDVSFLNNTNNTNGGYIIDAKTSFFENCIFNEYSNFSLSNSLSTDTIFKNCILNKTISTGGIISSSYSDLGNISFINHTFNGDWSISLPKNSLCIDNPTNNSNLLNLSINNNLLNLILKNINKDNITINSTIWTKEDPRIEVINTNKNINVTTSSTYLGSQHFKNLTKSVWEKLKPSSGLFIDHSGKITNANPGTWV